MIATHVFEELQRIVGPDYVLDTEEDLFVFGYDASLDRGDPDLVVLPGSVEEISLVMRLAHRYRIPVTPRGAGTNLSGGSVPIHGGLVLATTRLNRILEIDLPNRCAVVEPGVFNLALQQALQPHGYQYAPDPASQKVSTLGGNIGENSGGPHCLKYGVTLNHILGLEAVLPNGDVCRFGGRSPSASGYDMTGLMVGSEGTLGVFTKALVRIVPKAEGVRTLLVLFDNLGDAGRTVSAIISAGIIPATLEMMDRTVIDAVERATQAGLPQDVAALLIIEVDGVEDDLDEQINRITAVCDREGAREVRPARDQTERDELWASRRGAFGALGQLMPSYLVLDGTVPRTRLPEVLEGVAEIGERFNLPVGNVFHAGDGNLHPLFLFDPRESGIVERVRAAGAEILRLCTQVGGTITGEHGIGLEKITAMSLIFSDADIEAMRAVKRALDPEGIMNPGKILPAHREEAGMETPPAAETVDDLRLALPDVAWVKSTDEPEGDAANGTAPVLVALPKTAEQVARVLRAIDAAEMIAQVRPTHARAERSIGDTRDAVAVDLQRLNGILDHDIDNLTITVQAACTLSNVQKAARAAGQWLPLEVGDPEHATIGGILSDNVSGPRRLRYGTARDIVLGMEVALVNGEIIHCGGRTVKNVAGYDLSRLFIGSEGTLGIITAATFRLQPLPSAAATALASFEAVDSAFAYAQRICSSTLCPSAVQVFDDRSDGARPPGAAADIMVAVLFEASDAVVRRQLRDTQMAARDCGADVVDLPHGPPEVALWEGLTRSGGEVPEEEGVCLKASLSPAKLVEAWHLLDGVGGYRQACAGAGLLVARPVRTDGAAFNRLGDRIIKLGGSLVVYREGSALCRLEPTSVPIENARSAMQRIREEFDPKRTLSPRSCASFSGHCEKSGDALLAEESAA